MYGEILGGQPPQNMGTPPPGTMGAPPTPPGAPPGAALGLGLGKPPGMPGLPPPPTNVGAMPTGDPSTTKKEAADNAVLALREVKGHYPSLAQSIDPVIDQIKSAAKSGGAPKPAVGMPSPPGSPVTGADTNATPLSGSIGAF